MAKPITIDDLAAMIQRGFQETARRVEVDAQFAEVNQCLDRIEQGHKPRIEHLEMDVTEIKDALAM